jgi:thiosulfate/3-mercaptopyruvate sulfurtransferase
MLSTLVATEALSRHPEWRVFDCRHDLMKHELGEQQYREGHIPGALFAHLDRDLSAPKTGRNGRHPLPDPQAFIAWLGTQGLKPSDQVVCYDGGSGAMAARLWWMLRWVGHSRVAVLDGGWQAWVKSGKPVTVEQPIVTATTFNGRTQPRTAADSAEILTHLQDRKALVLDARAGDRYRGENETLDPVAGHIPGALNRFFRMNLAEDGHFKPAVKLKQEFGTMLNGHAPEAIIHQCGSGVTACHNLLAMEVAGLPGSRLYPGSWSEWVSDRRRPVATGAA